MTELPELRAAVKGAAERRARPAAARARRRRVIFKAGALAFGAALVTGSALAASGVWRPQVGDDHRENPTISASSVPAAQAEHFAVLRRPANDADHGEKVRYALRYLDGQSFHGVRTDAARLLSTAGSGYVLIPSTRVNGRDDALCLFEIDPVDGGGLSCWTTTEILAGKAVGLSIEPPELTSAQQAEFAKRMRRAGKDGGAILPRSLARAPFTVSGLVPDEVAAVEVSDGSSTRRATVANNFFAVTLAPPTATTPRSGGMPEVRWFDAGSKEVAK